MKAYKQPQITLLNLQMAGDVCVIFGTESASSPSPRVGGNEIFGGDEGLNGKTIL